MSVINAHKKLKTLKIIIIEFIIYLKEKYNMEKEETRVKGRKRQSETVREREEIIKSKYDM